MMKVAIKRRYVQRLAFLVGMLAILATFFQHTGLSRVQAAAGCDWKVIASTNPAPVTNILSSITALTANNVWAVGSALDKAHGNQTLIERWDGRKWRMVASPTPNVFGIRAGQLLSVSAISSNDIWAVGMYISTITGRTQTLTEHWDGKTWRIVGSPSPGTFLNGLTSVATVAHNDVWAVGTYSSARDGSSKTLTLHWNGKSWRIIASPNPANFSNILNSLTVVASNNIWSVGGAISKRRNMAQSQALIQHWDGKRWSVLESPKLPAGANGALLQGVSKVPGSKYVWAVGTYYRGGQSKLSTLTEFWNGKSWRVISSPNRNGIDNTLMSVTAAAPNAVWAVGGSSKNGPGQTLIERWDGARWSVSANINPGPRNTTHLLTSITLVPRSTQLWTAGFYGDGRRAATLTARFC